MRYSLNTQSPFGNQRLSMKAAMKFVVTEKRVLFKTHPSEVLDPAAGAPVCAETVAGTEEPSTAPASPSELGWCSVQRVVANVRSLPSRPPHWTGGGCRPQTFLFPTSTTGTLGAIQKMTRVRVVDNSALGNTPYHRPPRCIHVYTKNGVGKVGDRILLAIKGQKKKALIVGHRMPGPRMTPRFDSNNVVLIEDNGNPVGTRIKTPIPTSLRRREGEFSKVLAIAQNLV